MEKNKTEATQKSKTRDTAPELQVDAFHYVCTGGKRTLFTLPKKTQPSTSGSIMRSQDKGRGAGKGRQRGGKRGGEERGEIEKKEEMLIYVCFSSRNNLH